MGHVSNNLIVSEREKPRKKSKGQDDCMLTLTFIALFITLVEKYRKHLFIYKLSCFMVLRFEFLYNQFQQKV